MNPTQDGIIMNYNDIERLYYATEANDISEFFRTLHNEIKKGNNSLVISNALGKIADATAADIRTLGLKGPDMNAKEREQVTRFVKLTAFDLVTLCDTQASKGTRSKALQFLEYASYLNNSDYDIVPLAIKCCSYKMTSPGFDYSTIESELGTDILIYRCLKNSIFDESQTLDAIEADGNGSVFIGDGQMIISSTRSWEKNVCSLQTHDDAVNICTKNLRDEKLKASEIDKIHPLTDFALTFMACQEESGRLRPKIDDKPLNLLQKYTICADRAIEEECQSLKCSVLGTAFKGCCQIKEEELVKGIHTHELAEYLYHNDCIDGAMLVGDTNIPEFSIRNTYHDYCLKTAERDRISKRVFQAKVIGVFQGKTPDKDRVRLISDKGYPCLLRELGELSQGDIVNVNILFVNQQGSELYINVNIQEQGTYDTIESFDDENVLKDFLTTREDALKQIESQKTGTQRVSKELSTILQLGTIMSLSKIANPMDRFKDLITSAFLFNIAEEYSRKDRVLSQAECLHRYLRVAEGLPVEGQRRLGTLSKTHERIVNALKYLNEPKDIIDISKLIQNASNETEAHIARLLMANSLSETNPDDFKVCSTSIRKIICNLLGVVNHFRGDIVKGGGKYGKGELANVEFKSSYVMSNRTGEPDIERQGRGQVMEAVCGFMNKDGGTVYLGVNDSGDPLVSEGYGLNADIAWFHSNFDRINNLRRNRLGHAVPKPENLDSYCRFLNYEIDMYFKPALKHCVTISPTKDMDAIKIDVKPSEFEIAKLYTDNTWHDGIAYVRNGEETLRMSRHDQEQRLMKLRSVGKVEKFIITLTEAIDTKRKVILKGYASGNSNNVRDRYIVPINLVYNNENLWAYDLEEKETKVFRLSRITDIETDIENPEYPDSWPKGEADLFRWIEPTVNHHLKLRMTIAALNYLKEEYSRTKDLTQDELYQDGEDKWILDTRVHGWIAPIRFYLGLANQIEILETEDSEELNKAIKDFVDRYIK